MDPLPEIDELDQRSIQNHKTQESEWPTLNSRSKIKSGGFGTAEYANKTMAISVPSVTSCSVSEVCSKFVTTTLTSQYASSNDTRTRQQILNERKIRKADQKKKREEQIIEQKLNQIRAPTSEKIQIIDQKKADRIQVAAMQIQCFSKSRHARNKECNLSEFLDSDLNASTQVHFYAVDTASEPSNKRTIETKQPKGKTREVPKPKQYSALKKNIVCSREIRKRDAPISDSDVQSTINDQPEHNNKDYDRGREIPLQVDHERIFSRKFRAYCNNFITPELCQATEALLHDIFRFQDRAYNKNEIKARAHKRFVVGFKESQRQLEINKLKLLVIAPDLEPTSTEQFGGGLDILVEEIKSKCDEHEIPYVFAIKRWKLGRILLKRVPVSCVGIINADGSEENFTKLKQLLCVQKNLFKENINLN